MTYPKSNRLLAALPESDYERQFPFLQLVSLPMEQELYGPGDQVNHMYFPTTSRIAVSTDLHNGLGLNTAIVGKDSVLGLMVVGTGVSNSRAQVISAGFAYRISRKVLLNEIRLGGAIFEIWIRANQYLLNQLSQNAVCNKFHSVNQRLARWLLTNSDKFEINSIPLTHAFLASSIGVRREAVSLAFLTMNELEIVQSNRGITEILDRERLERMACECYFTLRKLSPFHSDNDLLVQA